MNTLLQLWREVCERSPGLVNPDGKHLIVSESDCLLLGCEIERTCAPPAPPSIVETLAPTDLKTVTFDASQWQLVPKKVTDEMAGAFMNGGEYPGRLKGKAWGNGSEEWYGDRERFDIDYSAMLAAAPTPAAQSAGQEAVSACSVCYGTGFDVNGKPCAFPHVPLRTAYTNAVPVNGGECRDEAGLTESDYATLEREHFGDPDKRTGIYAERAADAQQVGGRLLGWDDACVVLNSWLDKSGASFDDQCDLYCQLAALTSPAKVGGDRDAIAELIGRLEAKYGMEFTVTKRTGEKTHHVGFDRHPLIGRAVDYLRAAITSPAKVGGDEREAELNSLAHQLNASNERNGRLREALKLCSAELFANCADSPRAMSYVTEARAALDADGYARAALSADGGDRKDAERYRVARRNISPGQLSRNMGLSSPKVGFDPGASAKCVDAICDAALGIKSDADSDYPDLYRWLRDEHIGDAPESINLAPAKTPGLDAAIRAAIAAKQSHQGDEQ
ncbi:hypothetical protein [Pandoraea apista]|uniref:hypothetical protein n=1 Tax=Pandoraea apista TaxID=93218 RepID=UPI000657AA17|nr:hypothetical protein [Pandoraea apista]ALS63593.1 hypothetical protein AT395_00035 [Pandoraea apista]CFB63119.1 hypothetical protein LMG16407_03194 [Pandoraea apista]